MGVGKYKVQYGIKGLFASKLFFKRTVILNHYFMLLYDVGDCKAAKYLRRPFLFVLEMKTNNETVQWKVSWISGSSGFMHTWKKAC